MIMRKFNSLGVAAVAGMVAGVFAMGCIAASDPGAVEPVEDVAAPVEPAVDGPSEVAEVAPVEIAPSEVAPADVAPVEVAPTETSTSDGERATGPVTDYDTGVLFCGTSAAPAIDQDEHGNWWAYCEPALVD